MNDIIQITPPAPEPAATRIARSELAHLNSSLARRVENHIERFRAFWDNPECTPDEILEAMGESALTWLACASESVAHIGRLAALSGKTLGDFLPPEQWMPRREFVVEDGVVTLAPPAAGYDAHGVLIPLPEPIETEPTEAEQP